MNHLSSSPKSQNQNSFYSLPICPIDMDWIRGQTIGQGSSATVSIATANDSGDFFAVKSAELSKSEILQREQSILCTLNCPQVIAYKGHLITCENNKMLYNLLLEYAPGGSIVDAIRSHGGKLDEALIRSHTRAILLGLRYLHSNGIVHCDVKCHNILVTCDGPKIADFGCSKWVNERGRDGDLVKNVPISGTPAYMAPEVARGEHQSFPADIWALGCTVIEMATGWAPWANVSDPVSALYQIGFSGNMPEIPGFMSKQAQDFLGKCLKRDPMERWSASELLNHAYVIEEPNLTTRNEITPNSKVVTPTSVLNQDFWDTIETSEQETEWNWAEESPLVSPLGRIQQLSGGNKIGPNWEWDDNNWANVRSKSNGSSEELQEEGCREHCQAVYINWEDLKLEGLEYHHDLGIVYSETLLSSGINSSCDNSVRGICSHKSFSECIKDVLYCCSAFGKEIGNFSINIPVLHNFRCSNALHLSILHKTLDGFRIMGRIS